MRPESPFNLIITGVGGQGVVSLSEVFWTLCEREGWPCHGSIFKGGAQQHGSVTAWLRIFFDRDPQYRNFSPQIPPGECHLLLALEPWEGLRLSGQLAPTGALVVNSRKVPLLVERYKGSSGRDPLNECSALGDRCLAQDFTALALATFSDARMANYMLAEAAIDANLIPVSKERFLSAYLSRAKIAPGARKQLEVQHGT